MYPPIIIFRHGQTEWNREGIHQGRLDSPLTEMGWQQAMGPLGMTAVQDDRLQEVHFGDWQGRTTAEIDEISGSTKSDDPFMRNFTSPGGEGLVEMQQRVGGFVKDLSGPSIISTHGITSRVLRGLVLGLDADGMRDLDGGQGCIFLIRDGKHQRFG